MRLRILVLWLLALTAAFSNDIVAWNFPLAGYRESGPKRKLDAPPEPSVFFKGSEVLYDIMPRGPFTTPHPDPELDWLVWNETSGMMVGKGSWQALYLLADRIRLNQLPQTAKVVFDVFEFPEDGQVAADAIPACSFSATARNGKPFVLKQTNGPWRIEVEGNCYVNEWETDEDVRFSTKLLLGLTKGDETVKIQTAFRSRARGSVQLGRSVYNGHGIEVRASFQLLRPDGRILKTEIFEEKNGKAMLLDRALAPRTKTSEGWFQSIRISPGGVRDMSRDQPADDAADPFADKVPAGDFHTPMFLHPLVTMPVEINAWNGRPLWDLGEFSPGLELKPGEKIAHDPLRDQLCIFAKDEELFHKLDMLFMGCHLDPLDLAVTVTGQDELSVTLISCGKGRISRTNNKVEVLHSLETEAILGEGEDLIEANLELRHGRPENILKTTVVVWNGEKTPIVSAKAEEAETSWSLKAEVLRQEDHP